MCTVCSNVVFVTGSDDRLRSLLQYQPALARERLGHPGLPSPPAHGSCDSEGTALHKVQHTEPVGYACAYVPPALSFSMATVLSWFLSIIAEESPEGCDSEVVGVTQVRRK